MARLLLYAIPVVVMLYAFIDAIMTPRTQTRSLPKPLWIVLIVLIPLLGAIAWLLLGRPRTEPHPRDGGGGGGGGGTDGPAPRTPPSRPGRRRGSPPPDDDPEFLRRLDQAAWERKMRERRSGNAGGSEDG